MQTSYKETNTSDKNRFIANHWLHTECSNGLQLVTKTGILILNNFKGTGGDWLRERIIFYPNFPHVILPMKEPDNPNEEPEKMWFKIRQWDPFVTLNAISNDGDAKNAGWAVDDFGINRDVTYDMRIRHWIPMWADIAVRDTDGYIYRIGYRITLTGTFVDGPRNID